MTTKYRNKSGFKVVGNTSLRYLIPKEELITQLKFQISAGNRSVVFSHVTTSDDKEKLVKFIQSAEGRTERYAEDDFVLGGIDMPNQHTISASDLSGKTLGWATIKFGGDMEDRITPLYAIDDEICLLLMADLLEKFGSKMSDKVMVTVSALKEFVVTFIRTVPNVKLIRTQEMSFTKYNEYLPEKIKYLYFSQMF